MIPKAKLQTSLSRGVYLRVVLVQERVEEVGAVSKVKSFNRRGRNPESSGYAKNTKIYISVF